MESDTDERISACPLWAKQADCHLCGMWIACRTSALLATVERNCAFSWSALITSCEDCPMWGEIRQRPLETVPAAFSLFQAVFGMQMHSKECLIWSACLLCFSRMALRRAGEPSVMLLLGCLNYYMCCDGRVLRGYT